MNTDWFSGAVRGALRRLLWAPAYTLFSILSLGLGLGTATAVYSIVHAAFWSSPGIRNAHDFVDLVRSGSRASALNAISWRDYAELARTQTVFSGLAAAEPLQLAIATGGAAVTARGEAANGRYFGSLGVVPVAGRLLDETDERTGAAVVVISHALWKSRYAKGQKAIGQIFKVAGCPMEIVGIVPSTFRGVFRGVHSKYWIPYTSTCVRAAISDDTALRRSVSVKAKLTDGISVGSAAANVALIGQQLDEHYATTRADTDNVASAAAHRTWSVRRGSQDDAHELSSTIATGFVGCITLVLLISVTNLTNLSLARSANRREEMRTRRAVGASRARLIGEHLIESGFIILAGTLLGLTLAKVATPVVIMNLPLPAGAHVPEVTFAAPVVLAVGGALALVFCVFGLWPALLVTRKSALAYDSGTRATMTFAHWRSHKLLIAWQVAGSVVLFVVAAAGFRAIYAESMRDGGVDLEHLAVLQIDFKINGKDKTAATTTVDSLVDRIRADTGSSEVAVSSGLPFGLRASAAALGTLRRPMVEREGTGELGYFIPATANIFETLGVRLVRGRPFDDATGSVAVINETSARRLFGTTDIIGEVLLVRPLGAKAVAHLEVVGVAADTDTGRIGDRSGSVVYVPWGEFYQPDVALIVRSQSPQAASGMMRDAVQSLDPELAITTVGTGPAVLGAPFEVLRTISIFGAILGAAALLLALSGLYGVLSQSVSHRIPELAVRLALGADSGMIVRLVLREGITPVWHGLVLGCFAGILGRMALRPFFWQEISWIDPLPVLLLPVPMLCAAVLACAVPAYRAGRLEPNVALRQL